MILLKLFFILAWGNPQGGTLVPSGYLNPVFKDQGEEKIHVESLWVDKSPVTNAEFLKFVQEHPQWQRGQATKLYVDEGYLKHWPQKTQVPAGEDSYPVVNVSWFAARAYCFSQNKRLPSTTEWEYFAQTTTADYEAKALLWYSKAKENLTSVGGGEPNKFGLYDTHSLVWEWVEDFNSVFMTADSRQGFEKDMFCAGAAVGSKDPSKYASFVRYSMRASLKGKSTSSRLGFRCVKERNQK